MRITVLLVLTVGTCYCAPDSLGRSFIFGFIRDAAVDVSNQILSVTVLNGGDQDCQFKLTYRDDYDKPLHTTSTVAKKGMTEIPVPSWYGWQYESPGIQVDSGPNQLLTASSTCDVMLIANNFDRTTHQGDSYLVLPTSWAKSGSVFSFTLPPAANDIQNPGYQHITIIPTEKDVNGTLTVMGSNPLPFSARFGDQPTSYFAKKTPQTDPHTYRVEANGPLLLLAGVTCAGNYKACDHAAFMPHPLPTPECYERAYLDDDHPAVRANGFYLDVPNACTSTQTVLLTGNRGNLWKNISVPVTKQSSVTVVDPSYGDAIYFHAETAPNHITRYYDQSQNGKQGAFIGAVPSLSQYIYGNSTFYSRNDNDILEVICAIGFCISAKVDGVSLMSLATNQTSITIPIHGTNFYTLTATIPTKGFHTLTTTSDTNGPYSYFVIGHTANATYGYMGAVNMPRVIWLPTTTVTPSTISGSTPSLGPTTTTTRTTTTPQPPIPSTSPKKPTPTPSKPVITTTPVPSTTTTPTTTTTTTPSTTTTTLPPVPSTTSVKPVHNITSTAPPASRSTSTTPAPPPVTTTKPTPPAPPVETSTSQSTSTTVESTTKSASVPLYITVLLAAYLTL